MGEWNRGTIFTRSLDAPGRAGFVEIRDDIADGWEWAIYEGPTSRTFGLAASITRAKRAAMREAKRLGLAEGARR